MTSIDWVPRPAHFTNNGILDAALACVADQGPKVSVADIAAQLHGPVGSIYHRFASRDVLMVRLWLRSVSRFQTELFELAEIPDAHESLIAMALHIPHYCRAHRDEATGLTLFRQERLLVDCPDEVRSEVATLNEAISRLMLDMTRRRFGRATQRNQRWVDLAIRIAPYGLVRPYLGQSIPAQVDTAVVATSDAILRLGDPRRATT